MATPSTQTSAPVGQLPWPITHRPCAHTLPTVQSRSPRQSSTTVQAPLQQRRPPVQLVSEQQASSAMHLPLQGFLPDRHSHRLPHFASPRHLSFLPFFSHRLPSLTQAASASPRPALRPKSAITLPDSPWSDRRRVINPPARLRARWSNLSPSVGTELPSRPGESPPARSDEPGPDPTSPRYVTTDWGTWVIFVTSCATARHPRVTVARELRLPREWLVSGGLGC